MPNPLRRKHTFDPQKTVGQKITEAIAKRENQQPTNQNTNVRIVGKETK